MTNFKIFLLLYIFLNINNTFSEILSSFPEPIQQAEFSVYEIRKLDEIEPTNETGFFVAPDLFVTSFQSIGRLDLENKNVNETYLFQQGQLSPLKIQKVIAVSALFDLALLETQGTSEHYLNTAPLDPDGDLFTVGYPYGVLTKLQKTDSLLSEEAGYCFIHQASFEHSDGASGSPVLNTKGEAVGVVYTEIAPHTNSSCATDSDKINQLMENKIGTNCNTFNNAKDCIEQELNKMKVSLRNGTDTSRYIGMYRAYAYRQIQFTNHFETLQTIDVNLEQQENTLRKLNAEYKQLQRLYIYWLTVSAREGSFQAQYMVSRLYDEGENVPQNKSKASYWAKNSARQGFAPAQYVSGLHYAGGAGVKHNMQKALDWMNKAAEQGLIPAEIFLASIHSTGAEGVPQNLTQTFYWTKKSAEQGYPSAQYDLYTFYRDGVGTPHNIQRALHWLKTAADQGHIPSLKSLSVMHYTGSEGMQRNLQQAFHLTAQAAEYGDPDSQYNLFVLYANGEGTQKDLEKAMQWLEQAAEQGHEQALLTLEELSPESSILDRFVDLFKQ